MAYYGMILFVQIHTNRQTDRQKVMLVNGLQNDDNDKRVLIWSYCRFFFYSARSVIKAIHAMLCNQWNIA